MCLYLSVESFDSVLRQQQQCRRRQCNSSVISRDIDNASAAAVQTVRTGFDVPKCL